LAWFILFFLNVWCFACQAKRDIYPPAEAVGHDQIKQRVEQNKGKVILLNVWATWCEPCREEMPSLLKLRKALRKEDFELLLVSADDVDLTNTKVRPLLKEFGVDFLSFIKNEEDDETFMNGLRADWNGALPTSFLYDKDGTLVDMMIGAKTYEQFEKAIAKYLRH